MMLNKGATMGKQVVPERFVDSLLHPPQELFDIYSKTRDQTFLKTAKNRCYTSQWHHLGPGAVGNNVTVLAAMGIHGQAIWICPDTQTVIVKV